MEEEKTYDLKNKLTKNLKQYLREQASKVYLSENTANKNTPVYRHLKEK